MIQAAHNQGHPTQDFMGNTDCHEVLVDRNQQLSQQLLKDNANCKLS
jgi:hypothetical protein